MALPIPVLPRPQVTRRLVAALLFLAACITPQPPHDYDADPPELGGLRAAAAGEPTLRRYVVPLPTTTIDVPPDRDGLYIKGATTDRAVLASRYLMDGGRAGIITDVDLPHVRMVIADSIIRDADLWGMRLYGLVDARLLRIIVRNSIREHGGYFAVWGNCLIEDFTAINCAAQGLQLRLTGDRADAHWADPKDVRIVRFTALECGQARGAGRASFALTVKTLGPNADVLIDDCLIRTIRQNDVMKNSAGVWCDSFGGICVEFCRSLTIRGGYVEMKAPSGREAVQLFDRARLTRYQNGPGTTDIDGLVIAAGGSIAVPVGNINIRNCRGTGSIKVMDYTGGAWRIVQQVPLEQGYQQ